MSTQTENVKIQERKPEKKKKRGSVLIVVILVIVLILLLLSTIVLGGRLYNMSTRDQYSVNLGLGDQADGKLELFSIAYSNAAGQITVEGMNGQKVVAPGTAVDYDVRLKNQDDVIIDFIMAPDVEYFTSDAVPVQFKIVDTYGNYILGDEDTWVSAEEMNLLNHKGSVHPGEVYTYHISWQWAYESGADEYDTLLGNSKDAGLTVGLTTQSTANPDPDRGHDFLNHLLGEGFGCCWCCYLVWFLLLVILLMIIWVWRLKKAIRKQDDKLEEYEEILEENGLLEKK